MGIEIASDARIAGRYRLIERLGEGGMGVVWAAADVETEEIFALKFVKEAAADPSHFRRLLREARAACAIRHSNVVQVHEVLELEDGTPALVMELLQGESLAALLHREREIDLERTAKLILPVISAVGTAHSLGIVHRDLKPENIFLARDDSGSEQVKVLDFGIAKMTALDEASRESAGLTRTGALIGTPFYMAPEQVFGESDVDHRVDVWALGLILYRCLSGILPTERENVGQVLKVILTRTIWPLADAVPDLPRDVTALVDQMLAKDRDQRPADLRPAASVLHRYAKNANFAAFPEPAQVLFAHRSSSAVPPGLDVEPVKRSRRGLMSMALVGATLGVVASAVYSLSRASPDPQSATVPALSPPPPENPAPRAPSPSVLPELASAPARVELAPLASGASRPAARSARLEQPSSARPSSSPTPAVPPTGRFASEKPHSSEPDLLDRRR